MPQICRDRFPKNLQRLLNLAGRFVMLEFFLGSNFGNCFHKEQKHSLLEVISRFSLLLALQGYLLKTTFKYYWV